MGSNQTGLDPSLAGEAISTAVSCSNTVMEAVETGLKGILDSLKENWGTQDGKEWVEGDCTTEMNSISDQVAERLALIGKAIHSTATVDLSQTGNTQSVASPGAINAKHVQGELNDVLSNGFVGIFEELQTDAAAKGEELKTGVDAALGELQTRVIAAVDAAFNKVGQADEVSAKCMEYITQIQNIISKGLESLNTQIASSTKNADTFVKSIQDAGLRSSN